MPTEPGGKSGRDQLLDAAERLFAEHGINGVSLRQVGAAAGARNNSAAQYHFGDRDGLVRAIFERRMRPINEHRLTLLADASTAGVTGYVRALVEPLATAVAAQPAGTWYARFLDEWLRDRALRSNDDASTTITSGIRQLVRGLDAELRDQPQLVRSQKIELALVVAVRGFADFERKRDNGTLPAGLTSHRLGRILTDAIVGLLMGVADNRTLTPASATTGAR